MCPQPRGVDPIALADGGGHVEVQVSSERSVLLGRMRCGRCYERTEPLSGPFWQNGLAGGNPPPGAPLASMAMNLAVTGGTGAFLGARGQAALAEGTTMMTGRDASVAEDPANR